MTKIRIFERYDGMFEATLNGHTGPIILDGRHGAKFYTPKEAEAAISEAVGPVEVVAIHLREQASQ